MLLLEVFFLQHSPFWLAFLPKTKHPWSQLLTLPFELLNRLFHIRQLLNKALYILKRLQKVLKHQGTLQIILIFNTSGFLLLLLCNNSLLRPWEQFDENILGKVFFVVWDRKSTKKLFYLVQAIENSQIVKLWSQKVLELFLIFYKKRMDLDVIRLFLL